MFTLNFCVQAHGFHLRLRRLHVTSGAYTPYCVRQFALVQLVTQQICCGCPWQQRYLQRQARHSRKHSQDLCCQYYCQVTNRVLTSPFPLIHYSECITYHSLYRWDFQEFYLVVRSRSVQFSNLDFSNKPHLIAHLQFYYSR